jgi:hypothetical protein
MSEDVNDALRELFEAEPAAPSHEDAQYWLDVYTRLIDLTETMLGRTREYLGALPEPARRHVERVNIRVMEEEIAGFVVRRDFWRQRVEAMAESEAATG